MGTHVTGIVTTEAKWLCAGAVYSTRRRVLEVMWMRAARTGSLVLLACLLSADVLVPVHAETREECQRKQCASFSACKVAGDLTPKVTRLGTCAQHRETYRLPNGATGYRTCREAFCKDGEVKCLDMLYYSGRRTGASPACDADDVAAMVAYGAATNPQEVCVFDPCLTKSPGTAPPPVTLPPPPPRSNPSRVPPCLSAPASVFYSQTVPPRSIPYFPRVTR